MGVTLAPVERGDARRAAGALHQGPAAGARVVDLEVTRPQIYYGELTDDFVLRRHPPDASSTIRRARRTSSRRTTGRAGCRSAGRCAARSSPRTSAREDPALGRPHAPTRRMLYHRNIVDRAAEGAAVPALRPRSLHGHRRRTGTLHWMLDAYTAPSRYPYAARTRRRHELHAQQCQGLIDAYDGTVEALRRRSDDPIIRTHGRDLSRDLPAARRDAGGLARAPALSGRALPRADGALRDYHMDDPESSTTARTSGRSRWWIPSAADARFMRHIIMRLPRRGARAEFIFMRPFTPRQKDNLAAWMVAQKRRADTTASCGVSLPAAEPGVRAAPDRQPHQSGHRDLAADLAVGSARLAR